MQMFLPSNGPEDLKRDVRARIRSSIEVSARPVSTTAGKSSRWVSGGADERGSELLNDASKHSNLAALRRRARFVASTFSHVGQMPPTPRTFRGRVGNLLVRIVRRILFWYTPQIIAFHESVARSVEEQVAALEDFSALLRHLAEEQDSLCAQLRSVEDGLARHATARRTLEEQLASASAQQQQLRLKIAVTERVWVEQKSQLQLEQHRIDDAYERIAATDDILRQQKSRIESEQRRADGFYERILATERIVDEQRSQSQTEDHRLDAFYIGFENRFRGSREEIKDRLRVYVPLLQAHGIGRPETPILDIGCGRGEWLELLREHGMQGQGVDSSPQFVAQCAARGLAVTAADALAFLRELPSNSLGAVTGFHIVEHLRFVIVLHILDEIARVLKIGGMVILETPNPGNILVGSERFYFDPTHRRPLPSATLGYVVEAQGFSVLDILKLHPFPKEFWAREDGSEVGRRFDEYFFGPQDYAVIGQKV